MGQAMQEPEAEAGILLLLLLLLCWYCVRALQGGQPRLTNACTPICSRKAGATWTPSLVKTASHRLPVYSSPACRTSVSIPLCAAAALALLMAVDRRAKPPKHAADVLPAHWVPKLTSAGSKRASEEGKIAHSAQGIERS